MNLQSKNIIVGIGGGIAAYKSATLVRELLRRGAQVRVAMTAASQKFVGATTFTGLTGSPPVTDLWDSRYPGEIHVELSEWADAVAVAPATHNLMARFQVGLANDPVLAVLSCCSCPTLLAPAMHHRMWASAANRSNVQQLEARGVHFVGPVDGPLANGQSGLGRMAEPEAIADALDGVLRPGGDLSGKTILVTAGPTQEELDPVRFISNRSTGRMGFAVAQAAAARGATVIVVAGPTTAPPPNRVQMHRVQTALQMKQAVDQHVGAADAVVMTAAVADYRPKHISGDKLKKSADNMVIELTKNPDILHGLGHSRQGKSPVLVGFAMETKDVAAYARRKLEAKRVDLIVGNEAAVGFGGTDNQAILVSHAGDDVLPRMSKRQLADRICDRVLAFFNAQP